MKTTYYDSSVDDTPKMLFGGFLSMNLILLLIFSLQYFLLRPDDSLCISLALLITFTSHSCARVFALIAEAFGITNTKSPSAVLPFVSFFSLQRNIAVLRYSRTTECAHSREPKRREAEKTFLDWLVRSKENKTTLIFCMPKRQHVTSNFSALWRNIQRKSKIVKNCFYFDSRKELFSWKIAKKSRKTFWTEQKEVTQEVTSSDEKKQKNYFEKPIWIRRNIRGNRSDSHDKKDRNKWKETERKASRGNFAE